MMKMSFYDGTLCKNKLKDFIEKTEKPIVYTFGFTWKNPTTYRVPKTKAEAIEIVEKECWLDATEEEECMHLNAYGENDML